MADLNNGVSRAISSKGKGYWIAKWNDQEKVFYDGVFGTMTSAKNAADKWLAELSLGKENAKWNDRVEEFMRWLDTKKGVWGEEVVKEIQDKMIEDLTY
jgi:hypothetical protein